MSQTTRPRDARTAARGPQRPPVALARRSVFAAGLMGAGWSFLLGLTAVGVVVLVGWAATPHSDTVTSQALRAAAQVWLACQHVPVQLPAGAVSFLPLGLVAIPTWLGLRTGRWAAAATAVSELGPATALVTLTAIAYAALAAVLAAVTHTEVGAAAPAQGFAGAFVVSFVAVGVGVLREAGLWGPLVARVPEPVRPLLRETAIVLAVLVGAAAALVAVALSTHLVAVVDSTRRLGASGLGGLLLVLLGLAYLPDLILWGLAYLVGPGFAVGTGTSVSPLGHVVGRLPDFPPLLAVPGHAPGWAPVLLAAPVAAGVLVAWRRRKRADADVLRSLADHLAVAAAAGVAVAALTSLAAGALGPGRLSLLGPDALACGGATAGLVLLGLGLGALATLVEHKLAR